MGSSLKSVVVLSSTQMRVKATQRRRSNSKSRNPDGTYDTHDSGSDRRMSWCVGGHNEDAWGK